MSFPIEGECPLGCGPTLEISAGNGSDRLCCS